MEAMELSHHPVTTCRKGTAFSVDFPEGEPGSLAQDVEWCWVSQNGGRRKIRFHDYDEIYAIPGLYEHLFHDRLHCTSPQTVVTLLAEQVAQTEQPFSDLAVLDLGAGNGLVAEELAARDARRVIGVDILPAAAEAAHRDRPGVYSDYVVADLTQIPRATHTQLRGAELNCLTTVAALGFGDIPPLAFATAFNLITTPGWVAFNLKTDFLAETDTTGFSQLLQQIVDARILRIVGRREYRHRLSVLGEPLHYVAFAGLKQADIPLDWCERL